MTNEADLKQRLEQLAARLDRVERKLGLPQAVAPPVPPPPPVPTPAPAQPVAARTAAPRPAPPTAPPTAPPPRRPVTPPPTRAAAPRPKVPRKPREALEFRIGQKMAAWAGAIVIIFAVGFLVRYGYEEGWWTTLGPVTRCLLVAAFGAALIAAGELTSRRLGVAASVGLFGAGLGTLYLDAFAAFSPLKIVSLEWSFLLMAAVAILGFGITLRTRYLTIGILSVVGGYLTPWLLWAGRTHTLQVGIYLTMLLGISLALSMTRGQRFRAMRYVALGGVAVTGTGWLLSAIGGAWTSALVLATVWWAMVIVEATVAAIRGQSGNGNAGATLMATAWFVTAGCWVLHETQPAGSPWLAWFTLAVAAAAAAVALYAGPELMQLAGRPKNAVDRLAIALWAQVGVLLAVAVALRFDGFGQSVGWLAIGVGSIEIGRRLRMRSVDVFGLVVGALAVARIAVLDWHLPALGGTLLDAGQVHLTRWSILALAAVLATHTAARRLGPSWRAGPVVLAVIGTLGWAGLCRVDTSGLTTVAGWLLASVVLIALEPVGRRQRYFEIGMVMLWCCAVQWLYEAAALRVEHAAAFAGQQPVLNWQMAVVAAIVAVGWWSSRVLAARKRKTDASADASAGWQVALIGAVLLLLVGFSFEADRIVEILRAGGRTLGLSFGLLRQLLWTMLWALGAAWLGFMARMLAGGAPSRGAVAPRLLAGFARALLAACVLKWLIGDTLYWTVLRHAGLAADAWPLLNLQMISGVVVAASGMVLYRLTAPPAGAKDRAEAASGNWLAPAAVMLLLWGLSFEVDRAITHAEVAGGAASWDALQLRELWWTMLWAAGGLAMILWTRLRFTTSMIQTGWYVLAGAAFAWLSLDTLAWRLTGEVAPGAVVFNVQFLAGAATGVMVAVAVGLLRRAPVTPAGAVGLGLILVGLIGLWLGTLEIDRFAERLPSNAGMVRQMGWSIYWGLFAIVLILLGFARRLAACRYAGLALLALTLGKVVTVDMAEVRYVYRVLSFLVLGLLLVGTSVGYAKLWGKVGTAGTEGQRD